MKYLIFFIFFELLIISFVFAANDQAKVLSLVIPLLKFEEGIGPNGLCGAYIDSNSYPTIGYGKLCNEKKVSNISEAISLCDYLSNDCTPQMAEDWLLSDIKTKMTCISNYENINEAYQKLSLKRKAILVSMAYQMGCSNLSGFKKALAHMANESWDDAAREMLDSQWYKNDSPNRASRHAIVMKTNDCGNDFCSHYKWKQGSDEVDDVETAAINENSSTCNDISGCFNSLNDLSTTNNDSNYNNNSDNNKSESHSKLRKPANIKLIFTVYIVYIIKKFLI